MFAAYKMQKSLGRPSLRCLLMNKSLSSKAMALSMTPQINFVQSNLEMYTDENKERSLLA
jgi:hypothetical protein